MIVYNLLADHLSFIILEFIRLAKLTEILIKGFGSK